MSSRLHHIQRTGSGYAVRITRGVPVRKFFGAAKYGGLRGAKKAAIEFRDAQLAGTPAEYFRTKPLKVAQRNNKSTGVLGVCRTQYVSCGRVVVVYQASYKNKLGRFTVTRKRDEATAFRLAVELRKKYVRQAEGKG